LRLYDGGTKYSDEHNKILITKTCELNDRDFIIRNIYKDLYDFYMY